MQVIQLKMIDKDYTIKELSELFSVSIKTVQRHLKDLTKKQGGNVVVVPFDIVEVIQQRHYKDTIRTLNENKEFDIIEGFTNDEYSEFQKRLIEYPILKQQLEYHKKSAENHNEQMKIILRLLEQNNKLKAIELQNEIGVEKKK